MNAPRKVCVVTGSRADYGLLYWLMKEISGDRELQLQLIATGMHLSPEFGLTVRKIEEDGFTIDEKVEMLLSSDTPVGIAKSMGVGLIGFADALDRLRPDMVVVLGDRFEILSAAQAALVARLPIAHLHGGEVSEGAFDEGIRHAISKMAHLHFVAAEPYRKRLVQMGERPDRVFNVGAPGLDHLARLNWMSRAELEAALGVPLGKPLFLITYHPATLDVANATVAMDELLAALEEFPAATLIFTYPNADTGGRNLIVAIDDFVAKHPHRARAFASLGQRNYLSLMREADAVIGNSSSGLIEAPALQRPTVNIGERQKGRLKASSVVDVAETREDIVRGIRHVLSEQFRDALSGTVSLYGAGNASEKIRLILKQPLPDIKKHFFDIAHGY